MAAAATERRAGERRAAERRGAEPGAPASAARAPAKKGGINRTWLIVGGIALAAAAIYFIMRKGSSSTSESEPKAEALAPVAPAEGRSAGGEGGAAAEAALAQGTAAGGAAASEGAGAGAQIAAAAANAAGERAIQAAEASRSLAAAGEGKGEAGPSSTRETPGKQGGSGAGHPALSGAQRGAGVSYTAGGMLKGPRGQLFPDTEWNRTHPHHMRGGSGAPASKGAHPGARKRGGPARGSGGKHAGARGGGHPRGGVKVVTNVYLGGARHAGGRGRTAHPLSHPGGGGGGIVRRTGGTRAPAPAHRAPVASRPHTAVHPHPGGKRRKR